MANRCAFPVLFVLLLTACGSKDDGVAGPRFSPIAGDGGAGGEWASEGGAAGFDSTDPGASDPGASDPGASDPGAGDPAPSDPGPADPPPAPSNAPGCGADGNACCVNGDACTDTFAQCCTECTGSPDYLCNCSKGYKQGGNCRVCCVVCNNGKSKGSPLFVSASSCQEAAQSWCKSKYGVGADTKSGWRAQCG